MHDCNLWKAQFISFFFFFLFLFTLHFELIKKKVSSIPIFNFISLFFVLDFNSIKLVLMNYLTVLECNFHLRSCVKKIVLWLKLQIKTSSRVDSREQQSAKTRNFFHGIDQKNGRYELNHHFLTLFPIRLRCKQYLKSEMKQKNVCDRLLYIYIMFCKCIEKIFFFVFEHPFFFDARKNHFL